MKTSELTGSALNWAVAICVGMRYVQIRDGICYANKTNNKYKASPFAASTNWAQGGPLLNKYKISRTIDHSGLWVAYAGYNLNDEQRHMQCDALELVAGLRCFVASKLGYEIDIPVELAT